MNWKQRTKNIYKALIAQISKPTRYLQSRLIDVWLGFPMNLKNRRQRKLLVAIGTTFGLGLMAAGLLWSVGFLRFDSTRVAQAGIVCPSGYTYDTVSNRCAVIETNRNVCISGDTYNNDGSCSKSNGEIYNAKCPTGGWLPYSPTQCYLTTNDLGYILDNLGVGEGVCNPDPITIGATTTCRFSLSGSAVNVYFLPANPVSLQIQGASSNTTNCAITNNGTSAARLQCVNVSSAGAGLGLQNLNLDLGTGPTTKGQIEISNSPLTAQSEEEVVGFNPSDCNTYSSQSRTDFNDGQVCIEKLYQRNGKLYRKINIKPGDTVNTRLYYNNTSTSSLPLAQLQDSIPTGFALTNQPTNQIADTSPRNITLTGTSFNIAPNIGYYSYSTSQSTSNLEFGKKKYLNLAQCIYTNNSLGGGGLATSNHSDLSNFINLNNTSLDSATRLSNTLLTGINCGSGTASLNLNNSISNTGNFLISGNRYLNLQQCQYFQNEGLATTFQNDYSLLIPTSQTSNYSTGTNISNAIGGVLNCGGGDVGSINRIVKAEYSGTQSLDLLGNRYLHLQQCNYQQNLTLPASDQNDLSSLLDLSNPTFNSNTKANNTPTDSLGCGDGTPSAPLNLTYSGVLSLDTADITRGYGFISYDMIASNGLSIGSRYGTDLGLTGESLSALANDGTDTIYIIPDTGFDTEMTWEISSDGGNNWSTNLNNVSSQDKVLLRVWYKNNLQFPVQNSQISFTLPAKLDIDTTSNILNCLLPANATTPICSDDASQGGSGLSTSIINSKTITVSPSAGLFGQANSASSGILDMSRLRYGYLQSCSNGVNRYYVLNSFSNSSTQAAFDDSTCVSTFGAGFNTGQVEIIDLLGSRYLHNQSCSNGSIRQYYPKLANNLLTQSPLSNPDCIIKFGTGFSSPIDQVTDILGQRYSQVQSCGNGSSTVYLTTNFDSNGSPTALTNSQCENLVGAGFVAGTGNSLDMYSSSLNNSRGYIQFSLAKTDQLDEEITIAKSTASLRGDGVTSDRPNVDLSINFVTGGGFRCPYLEPLGGLRNISLSDAEFRTDQDFYCNYESKICPVVFEDTDNDGQLDQNESLVGNQQFNLLDGSGSQIETLLSASPTSNQSTTKVCSGEYTYYPPTNTCEKILTQNTPRECPRGGVVDVDGNCSGSDVLAKYAHVSNFIDYNDSSIPYITTFAFNDDPFWARDNSNTTYFTKEINQGDTLNYRTCINEKGGIMYFATRMWKTGETDPGCDFGYQPELVGATLFCRSIGGNSRFPDQWADFESQCYNGSTFVSYFRMGSYDNLATTLTVSNTATPTRFTRNYWYGTFNYIQSLTTWNGYGNTFDDIASSSSGVVPMGISSTYLGSCPVGSYDRGETMCATIEFDPGTDIACFDSLIGDTNYQITHTTPLTSYQTTGGNPQRIFLPYQIERTIVYFGYSTGGFLTLDTPELVNLGGFEVSARDVQTQTLVSPISVIDTRPNVPGWNVSCVVSQDFVDNIDANKTLPIANRFGNQTDSISKIGGDSVTGVLLGQPRNVSSFVDPFTLAIADQASGNGSFEIGSYFRYLLPSYSKVGNYQTVVSCTAI
jgi:hypothetical protein